MHPHADLRALLRSALDLVRSVLAWPPVASDLSRREPGASRRRSPFDPFMSQDPQTGTAPTADGAADAATPASPQGDGFETQPPTSPASAGTPGGVISGEEELHRQLQEHKDRYLRLAAEFDNHRRRTARERDELGARAQAELVRHLIDALDDLGRFAHVDPSTTDASTVVQGVEMVEKKLGKALGGAGLQVVDPTGQPFDPALHEAVGTEPAASAADDHTVARVYQVGYLFGGQLLRPARVVVRQHG